jgi:hypothetical protein
MRNMTSSSDRLPAIAAVMARVKGKASMTPVAGLWQDTLTENLHWTGRIECLVLPFASYVAPSWSWASVDGPVHWTLGVADGLPATEKKWDLKLLDLACQSSSTWDSNLRGYINVEGRLVPSVLYSLKRDSDLARRKSTKYMLCLQGTSEWQDFYNDVGLEARTSEFWPHYGTVCRKSPDSPEDEGDWYSECATLLLVVTGPTAAGLVIARSIRDPNCWERIGLLLRCPVKPFLGQTRTKVRIE